MSANMAYGEVKLEPLGAGIYEDPDKIVNLASKENCQLTKQSAVVSEYDTVGEK